jgi:eukaryotic-like serine/threonine-protein kinase
VLMATMVGIVLIMDTLAGCGGQPDPKPRWATTLGYSILTDPTASGDLVIVEVEDSIHALVASTGAPRWQRHPLGTLVGRPVVADGALYITGDRLFALDAASGRTRWTWPFPPGVRSVSDPAVAGGLVYVAANETDRVYVLDTRSGTLLANAHVGAGVYYSTPVLSAGRIFVEAGRLDDRLSAFDATTGTLVWSHATPGGQGSDPVLADGSVFVTCDGGRVYAFDADTGASTWSTTTSSPGQSVSAPLVSGGVIYVGSEDHHLYALSTSTGTRIWTAALGGFVHHAPALDHGVLYVGAGDGGLYALDAAKGTLRGVTHPGIVGGTPVVSNGVVYAGTLDGKVYAYDAGSFR